MSQRNVPRPPSPWVVLKFGGTSVSSAESWERIAKTTRERLSEGLRPLVVCSALSQISNRLEQALASALEGETPNELVETLLDEHATLARALGIECPPEIGTLFEQLSAQLGAISATREASPRLQAEVLATGELCSTHLGAAWLRTQGLGTRWIDARNLLRADPVAANDLHRQYLSATCDAPRDDTIADELDGLDAAVVMTQGFIVGAPCGGTALLGRGGSDTSATYFGQALDAQRVEIWTDVPGLYSADPRLVPDAMRLRRIGYDEVIELATRGAKILHPRSLVPARAARIPVEVRSTRDPSEPGTVIQHDFRVDEPAGLAISSRKGMAVVTMDVELSWQRVGVIADLSACFARNGLSIDSIASSQTRVSVSLDPSANPLDADTLKALLDELARFSDPVVISPVASVSIVGTRLQRVLHAMPSLFAELSKREIHLLSHSANDHSLTIVVDESETDVLVRTLHAELVSSELGVPEDVRGRRVGRD